MATDSEEQVSPGEKQMEGSIFYFFLPKHSPILFITRQPETLSSMGSKESSRLALNAATKEE